MRNRVGVIVVGLGLGFALYATAPNSIDREAQVAAVTRIIAQSATPEGPQVVAAEQPGLRQPVAIATREPLLPNALSRAAGAVDPARVAPIAQEQLSEPSKTGSPDPAIPVEAPWQVVITAAPATSGASQSANTSPAAEATRPAPQDKIKLARLIQAELKRLGCYHGKINGTWGPSSQHAMASFLHSVNASLPTTEPDVILLNLVQGHSGTLCAPTCENGSGGNRCPHATVVAGANPAHISTLRTPAPAQVAAVEPIQAPKHVPRPEPLPGRMAVGALPSPSEVVPTGVAGPENREVLPWQGDGDRAGDAVNRRLAARSQGPIASRHLAALEQARSSESRSDQALVRNTRATSYPDDLDEPSQKARRKAPNGATNRVVRRTAPEKSRQIEVEKKRRPYRYATRSVQYLFLHPLGRM